MFPDCSLMASATARNRLPSFATATGSPDTGSDSRSTGNQSLGRVMIQSSPYDFFSFLRTALARSVSIDSYASDAAFAIPESFFNSSSSLDRL